MLVRVRPRGPLKKISTQVLFLQEGVDLKSFLAKTLNGMTYGLFATIVVGVIIQQIGTLFKIDVLSQAVYPRLALLMGAGIGMGVGMSLKLDGLKFLVLAVAGGIATSFKVDFSVTGWYAPQAVNNPITAYVVVLITYTALRYVFKRKTNFDLFLIPIVGILVSVLATFIVSWPIDQLMTGIYQVIKWSMQIEPYTTTALVSLIFGVLLTLPVISSAGVAIAVFSVPYANGDVIASIAMAAAVVGTTTQMIGFAYQSRKNDIGTILSVGIASSMFQFKNVIKKPVIWIPTLVASFILGPINYLIFHAQGVFVNTPQGAGMGTAGLVGLLQTLQAGNYQFWSWMFVASLIVLPIIVVGVIDYFMIKANIYQSEDLLLDQRV